MGLASRRMAVKLTAGEGGEAVVYLETCHGPGRATTFWRAKPWR